LLAALALTLAPFLALPRLTESTLSVLTIASAAVPAQTPALLALLLRNNPFGV